MKAETLYLPATAAELLEFLHPITSWTFRQSLSTFFFLETLSKEINFQVFCGSEGKSGQGKAQILLVKMWLQMRQADEGRAFVMLVKLPLSKRFPLLSVPAEERMLKRKDVLWNWHRKAQVPAWVNVAPVGLVLC